MNTREIDQGWVKPLSEYNTSKFYNKSKPVNRLRASENVHSLQDIDRNPNLLNFNVRPDDLISVSDQKLIENPSSINITEFRAPKPKNRAQRQN